MRLINIHTLKLETFVGREKPNYVCLSHRWSEDEPTFEDYENGRRLNSVGMSKIKDFCTFLRASQWGAKGSLSPAPYAWVDTVCIDKRSSAELSEAINSMGQWYAECEYCVAYLADAKNLSVSDVFANTEWFRRGWTLQELLFPKQVIFCFPGWTPIGTKHDGHIQRLITGITGIPQFCLQDHILWKQQCVAQKMSWAAHRTTTRIEDEAYCLLGIFGINMPLLYGEGSRAFHRLQTEIIRQTDEESIFSWAMPSAPKDEEDEEDEEDEFPSSMLAESPEYFQGRGSVEPNVVTLRRPYTITNRGLEFHSRALLIPYFRNQVLQAMEYQNVWILELNCSEPFSRAQVGDERRTCLVALIEHHGGKFYRLALTEEKLDVLIRVLSTRELEDGSVNSVQVAEEQRFYIDVAPRPTVLAPSWEYEAEEKSAITLGDMLAQRLKCQEKHESGTGRDEWASV